jgi:hypothetical protein
MYGDVSLSDGIIEYAKTHEEIKGAFLTFQKDADQIYPGWKEQLGYTGESSVQAASFDWKKKQRLLHSSVLRQLGSRAQSLAVLLISPAATRTSLWSRRTSSKRATMCSSPIS